MKKIRLVFQGDSITDAGRDKRNYHDLGPGYPKFAAEHMTAALPDVEFEFLNFGIGGKARSHSGLQYPRTGWGLPETAGW